MYTIKKIVGATFWISLVGYLASLIYKFPLPEVTQIKSEIIQQSPKQKEVKMEPVKMAIKGFDYEITPLFDYEIQGLVVEQYSSSHFLDFYHKSDPGNTRDLCLVWGKTIENGAYREVKYSHGEFTCYVNWKRSVVDRFDPFELSNNHLLPKNEFVAREINKAKIGDQVRIRGWLSKYAISQNGQLISTRGTSTTREDMGNGACETILVTEFEILADHNRELRLVKQVLPVLILVTFILTLGLSFVEAEPKIKAKITIDQV